MKTVEFPSNLSPLHGDNIPRSENITLLSTLNFQNISDWGPKRDPLFIVIPFTVLFVTIFFTGLIGNISTCIVIARNKSMHTATNYYLFSLAISDLLLLISGLPQDIYYIWFKYPYAFGEAFCVLQGFAAETSANATVLTITAFTVERYIAICRPFLSHSMSKLSRAIKLILSIWIFAMCLAIPQAMAFGIVYEILSDEIVEIGDHYTCNVKRTVIPHAFLISTLLFFVTPMTLITILYILIGLQLRQSTVGPVRGGSIKLNNLVYKQSLITQTNRTNQTSILMNENDTSDLQLTPTEQEDRKRCSIQAHTASRHVVKMLVAVVVAFFICWAPFHAQRLLAIYGQSDSSDVVTTYSALTYISGVLYYLSTTINPVLYHIMSHKFRMAFKETFSGCLIKKQKSKITRQYSSLSRKSSSVKGSRLSNGNNLYDARFMQAINNKFKRKRKLCRNGKSFVYLSSRVIKDSNMVTYCEYPFSENNDNFNEIPQFQSTKKSNLSNPQGCNGVNMLSSNDRKDLEEIEIFHEERLCIKTVEKVKDFSYNKRMSEKCNKSNRRSSSYKIKEKRQNAQQHLSKSVTMPNMKTCELF